MSNLKRCLKNQQVTQCYRKAVCFILTFALLLVPSFTSVRAADLPAETIGSESDSAYTILDQNNQSGPYIATDDEAHTELISQRTAAGKTYLLDSKRYEAVVYAYPVHYLQDGEYQEIDNSLEATTTDAGSVRYTNRANSFTASFADRLGDGQTVSISKDGSTLSWSVNGLRQGIPATAATSLSESEWSNQSKGEQRRTVPNLSTQVTYRDVLPDTHLEVWLIADHFKENLVLEKYTGLKTVSQTITAASLELALQTDGSILARNGETVVFFLPAPYAYDASGDNLVSIDVTLEESTAGEKGDTRVYQLTWHLDTDWMARAAYPVTIDPTVYTSLAQSDIKDALISENYPNVNYGLNAKLNTGEGSSSATNYSLIRFPELPAIGSASMVQYSGLRLTKKTLAAADSIVTVHEVTSTWDSMSVTWATCPSFSSTVDDWQTVDKEAGGEYEWDITRIAKKWYTGSTNYGVLLKDISQTGAKQEYYSSDSGSIVPYAYFVYTNYSGLEGYWDYTGSSLGRSGAASINLYNGNLVYTHSDVAMTGNRLPIAVTHVFNSTTRDDNDSKMLYGKGWRTNYDQRVSTVTIDTVNYYKYIDEDGTIHYFRQVGGIWKDESGLDLKLTVASYVVTITDKNDNFLMFHPTNSSTKPGFLNYIQDRNGNRQTVGYDANSRISQVTDAAGRIVKFNRDAGGNLTQIGEPTAGSTWRYTTFAYTSSRLTSITYPDGEVTSFVYNTNGNMDYVSRNSDYSDGSGTNKTALSKLDLAYTSLAPYRVTYVGELATVSDTTTDGAHAHLSYGYNCTTLEDSEGRKATYQFNDSGNTVCVTGPDGGAAYAGYSTDSASGSMSKATSVSRFQKFSKNLLQNHNAELSANWVLFSASGSTGTHTYATDQKYLGNQSIKLVKTNTTAYEAAQQTAYLVKGVTYTFSGYIKTSGISESSMGAQIRAGYYNSSGTYVAVSSTCVKGTQDWTRYNLTFTLPADATSTTVYLFCLVYYSTGTAWFDALQLEEGSVANRYNMVENADFANTTSNMPNNWTTSGLTGSDVVLTTADSTNPVTNDDKRFIIYGTPGVRKYIEQSLNQSGAAGDAYVCGAWAKGASVALNSGPDRHFIVAVYFDYTDPAYTDEWIHIRFSEDTQSWQYACGAAVAKYAYQNMIIRFQYRNNANSAEFDAAQLFREEFGSTYTYDDNGNLTDVVNAARQTEQFSYTNNDLTQYIDTNGKTFTYTYDTSHNLLTATSAEGIVYTFTYDSYGNQLSARVGDATNNVKSTVSYASGNYTDIVTDPFGKTVNYNYDAYKGTLSSVVDPLGNTVSNTYNGNTDALLTTSQTSGGVTMTNTYTYLDDRLTRVAHNSTSGTVGYDFEYNCLGWTTGVQVTGAANNLVTYTLQARTGRLNALTYGNGDVMNYSYDDYDQLKTVSEGSTALYAYEYDDSGNVGYQSDMVQNKKYWYEYDLLDRLGKIMSKDASETLNWSQYTFNAANSLSLFKEFLGGVMYQTSYAYDDDSRPLSATFGTYSKNWVYDTQNLNRTASTAIKNGSTTLYTTTIGYVPGDGTTSTRSYRVATVQNGSETLTYTYDDRGYITEVRKDTNNYSQYLYDGFGQLIRENYKWDATSFTKIYTYDVGGNITYYYRYAFADGDSDPGTRLGSQTWTYDSTWKDKLIGYNGATITYDEIGNPLTDGTWTYTWAQGRKLQQIAKTGTTISYKYNDSGIRTEKTVNGVTTVYNVVGGQVTWEKTGSNNPIYYTYDASGSLWGMQYNGSMYFYVRNAQGDIIKIINSTGSVVVEYAYDAWGRQMSTTGSLAGTLGVDNPYRYRGYRFDTETGLYYLQSRYYNPQWGRFVNADDLVGVAGTIGSHNIFAYCFNSPVIYSDEQGQYPSYSFNYEYDLGRGWFARFDRGGAGRSPQDHVHVYNKYEEYKQNKDGSSHDNSIGSPPNKIKEKLKEKTGWDWDKMVMLNPSRRLIEQQQNMALDAMKGRQSQQAYSNGFSMPNLNAAGRVMLGSAGLYVAYRAARMLISLIPGLWWTAPANVACP